MYGSYLSYSGYQSATGCLYRYFHAYKARTPYPPDDRLGMVYGSVVGRLFEIFFKDRFWRTPGSNQRLLDLVEPTVDAVIAEEQKPKFGRPGGKIVWRPDLYANREALVSDVRAAIPRGLATIKVHRLIGLDVKTEFKLDSTIGGHRIAGRADFVMVRVDPHHDLVILDGKGSRKRGKFADTKQLLWYSLLYREHHGRLPDRSAFVYWHYDPPSNIDWCTIDPAEIDGLKNEILALMGDLQDRAKRVGESKSLPVIKSIYKPSPHIFNCRFCPYATPEICPQGSEVVAKAAAARESKQ